VTYGVTVAERLDVEKGESFLRFEEFEAGDFAWREKVNGGVVFWLVRVG
jgi:hypothetical protein